MKAILVIDMPKSCKECQLKYLDTGDDAYFGNGTERCVIDGSEICMCGRYEDCPLKPMPKKIDILEQSEKDFDAYPDGYLADKLVESQGYKRHGCCTDVYLGWNACVDELDDDELDFSGFGGDWG